MQQYPFAKRSDRPAQAATKAARRHPTIILADDSILQRMMTRALLESEGYHVLEAGNGQEVLDLMRLTHPDLIIMDVAMPSMDGVTAARRIRDHAARVPIVFVTALGASGDRASALAAGGSDYLVKPIAERELLKVVEGYTRRR